MQRFSQPFKVSIILYLVLLFLIVPYTLFSSTPIQWHVGEELSYKVKWSFLRLGILHVRIADTTTIDSTTVYHAIITVDSNPYLFFVNYHSEFHTYFDKDLNVYLFHFNEKEEGVTYRAEYRFNYHDSLIAITLTDTTDTLNTIQRQIPFRRQILDGSSLLFYARQNAWKSSTTDTVYYLADDKTDQAILHFHGYDRKIKIKSLKEPIPCYYLDGFIRDKGVAGLSGFFKGWFYSHPQRPPIKAKLKVFIGYVAVELEKWKNIDL